MLHKETVDPVILDVITALHQIEDLKDFYLVGGTSLALQLGHRKSVDIDLFSGDSFNPVQLSGLLEEKLGFQVQYIHRNTLKGIISGVFVDIITHNYPLIKPVNLVDNIPLASPEDIAAMKINAITGNGTRVKDFIDIYFLLKEYSLAEIFNFYREKYSTGNDFHALKSLTYFDDVDSAAWPEMVAEKNLTFTKVKKVLLHERDLYLKT
ncbi:MAG TPA: nucleotidyl transferase AbiEii/AbiGii toxin family protein [Prolixibacteraceae bacterium]|nr:nucleotidyl transferase AbiEii/AbiGii toxin family protein [Prolixibacteraceae bacterium]HRV89868.1 nucleotidyl transferase AbiEii/AbiGii toxin family protein [Prolixibacteraceae bacterium]